MLGFDRGVALQLGLGHQAQERKHELVACRHRRVRVDHGFLGVYAACQVVHDHVVDVVLDMLGGVAVGDDLVVGDEDIRANAHVLQLHAPLQRAEVMAQVKPARGAVTREHRVFLGMAGQISANFVAALLACLEASFVRHI